jgi:phi13 family phage major tail protein
MIDMDQKYGEFVGVDKVYTFDILQDDDGNYVAGTPEYFCPVASIAGEPEIANKTTYYDNKAANNYVTEGMTALTIVLSNVPADKMADHLGKHYDAESGRVYDTGEANPPDKGIMFRYNMGKAGYRYYCYLKGTFSGGTEEAETKTNDVNEKTYQTIYTAVSTTHEWSIDGVLKPLKRVFGDTSDPAFDATGWFTQAQTPDTSSAPSALTIDSVPSDAATGIAISNNIVITFNNKIATYDATMIKSDFTTVPNSKTFDSTGKILTINPTSDLSAASSYAVILTNVKDIYGQILADQVINFTTA